MNTKKSKKKIWALALPLCLAFFCLGVHVYSIQVAAPWYQQTYMPAAWGLPHTDNLIFYPTLLFCTAYLGAYLGIWMLGRKAVRLGEETKTGKWVLTGLSVLCVLSFALYCLLAYLYIGMRVPFAQAWGRLCLTVHGHPGIATIPGAILGGVVGYRQIGSIDAS